MKPSLTLVVLALLASNGGSASIANSTPTIRFGLSERDDGKFQLDLERDKPKHQHFSLSFRQVDLPGMNKEALRGPDGMPIRFTLAREAGRLDCVGASKQRRASGTCRLTSDSSFTAFLHASQVARPSEEDLLDMVMVGTPRELVQALTDARYSMPTPHDLVALTAVGVTADYVRSLGAAGYPRLSIAELIQLKAVGVSPNFVQAMRKAGYDRLSASELVQLKVIGVDANFIMDLKRRGYHDLPVSRLVQFRIFGNQLKDTQRSNERDGPAIPIPQPIRL